MGHQKNKAGRPRRGSLAFSPRVKAKRIYPRIKHWPKTDETRLLGFAGYKTGMSHAIYVDNHPHRPTKGQKISSPVTILEVPKTKVGAIKLYGKDKRCQKKCLTEIWAESIDKDLKRKISFPKKKKSSEEALKKAEELLEDTLDITALVYTVPNGSNHRKKPEIFEVGVGGKDVKSKFDYVKSILGNELKVEDLVKPGEQLDIVAVTKGKGFQGTIKRFNVKLERKKTDRTRRGVASIGPDVPRKVSWKVPMPGQMGFHNRYDYNKWVLKVGTDSEEINPKCGIKHYGKIKGDYIVIKGSIPGPTKRIVRTRLAMKPRSGIPNEAPTLTRISKL